MTQPDHSGEAISILKVRPILQGADIAVNSPGIDADGRIDPRHSAIGGNISPVLSWTAIEEAAAYALIVEDPDAPRESPFVHWIAWNIPSQSLPERLPNTARLVSPQGMVQGRNDSGGHGWFGPKPPAGHGPHRYHFQVFALARALGLDPEAPLIDLVQTLKGDTLAEGEVVGTYETPPSQ